MLWHNVDRGLLVTGVSQQWLASSGELLTPQIQWFVRNFCWQSANGPEQRHCEDAHEWWNASDQDCHSFCHSHVVSSLG